MEGEKLYKSYWKSIVNKREVAFAIVSFLERLDALTDSVLIGVLQQSSYRTPFIAASLIFDIKYIRKFFFLGLFLVRNLRLRGIEEISRYTQNYWKLSVAQGFYVVDNFMNKFSPSDTVRLSMRRWPPESQPLVINYKTLMFGFVLVFEALPLLVVYFAVFLNVEV